MAAAVVMEHAVVAAPMAQVASAAPTRKERRTLLYKDLACLVHLNVLTLQKINLVTQISKSSVCTHLEPWRHLDMGMLETIKEETIDRVKVKFPDLFPADPGAGPLLLPAVEAPWEDLPVDTGAAKLKRAAQVAAITYRDINRVTWRVACAQTLAAFGARKFKHPVTKLNPIHLAVAAKAGTLVGEKAKMAGRPPALHGSCAAIEDALRWTIDYLRSTKSPVWKGLIFKLVNFALEPLGDLSPLPLGATDSWYEGFLRRNNFKSFNEEPLDITRELWMTAVNLFKSYLNFAARCILLKVAVKNDKWVSYQATPNEPPIVWIKEELWRVFESDEIGFDLGIKTEDRAKTQQERMVGRKGCCRLVVRDAKSKHHISGLMTISWNDGGQTMMSGMCMDAGEGACLGEHKLQDDDGTPFTVPLPDGNGGVEETEVFWWSNKKGSWDQDAIIAYMKVLVERHQRIHKKRFTEEKPGIWFVDGCQVHICQAVIVALRKLHVEVQLKLPYSSSKTNTMDARGACARLHAHALNFLVAHRAT